MTFSLTDKGREKISQALSGQPLCFSSLAFGNGEAQSASTAVGLANPLIHATVSEVTLQEDGQAVVTAQFTNESVETGFRVTEVGLFARDEGQEGETLCALGSDGLAHADYIPAYSERILTLDYELMLFVGDSANVSATVSSNKTYVTREQFQAHTDAKGNPHGVTKHQLGLDQVENVSVDRMSPHFSEQSVATAQPLRSGDTLSTLFGKLARAVTTLIDHVTHRANPHSVTCDQIKAAPIVHTHKATDVNEGVLQPQHGGTGVGSLTELADRIDQAFTSATHEHTAAQLQGVLSVAQGGTGVTNLDALASALRPRQIQVGHYVGDGASRRDIPLGFTPSAVLLMSVCGQMAYQTNDGYWHIRGGLAVRNDAGSMNLVTLHAWANASDACRTFVSGYTALMLGDAGFTVSSSSGSVVGATPAFIETNQSNTGYYFIAFG